MNLEGRDSSVVAVYREFNLPEEKLPSVVESWLTRFKSLASIIVREIEDDPVLVTALSLLNEAKIATVEAATGNRLFVNSVEGKLYKEESSTEEEFVIPEIMKED